MTYLQIVNKVLKRLREREVSSVDQTTYSAMVGEYVNDAKTEVEDAWDWSANRSIISVDTVASTSTVTLTGFGLRGKVLSAYNDTSNSVLKQRAQGWFDRQNYTSSVPSGSPSWFCFRGDDGTDSKVELISTPDAVYTLKFNTCSPQEELDTDSTVLQVPWRPVVLLAVAMLSDEKGETGTTNSLRLEKIAMKSLSDHVAYDAAHNPLELNWYEV